MVHSVVQSHLPPAHNRPARTPARHQHIPLPTLHHDDCRPLLPHTLLSCSWWCTPHSWPSAARPCCSSLGRMTRRSCGRGGPTMSSGAQIYTACNGKEGGGVIWMETDPHLHCWTTNTATTSSSTAAAAVVRTLVPAGPSSVTCAHAAICSVFILMLFWGTTECIVWAMCTA